MAKTTTCGMGLAAHAALPAKLSELLAAMAHNLELHQGALDLRDERARDELEAYVTLAREQQALAEQLRLTAERMVGYHDLPSARHDERALADPRRAEAFARFVQVERELLALIEKAVERDDALLAESDEEDPMVAFFLDVVRAAPTGAPGSVPQLTALLAPIPPTEALPKLIAAVRLAVPADALAVWRLDTNRGAWRIAAAEGLTDTYVRAAIDLAGTKHPRMPDTPVVAEDVHASPILDERRAGLEREGIRSVLAIPLRLEGENRATLTFYWKKPQTLDAARVAGAAAVGSVIAPALENRNLLK